MPLKSSASFKSQDLKKGYWQALAIDSPQHIDLLPVRTWTSASHSMCGWFHWSTGLILLKLSHTSRLPGGAHSGGAACGRGMRMKQRSRRSQYRKRKYSNRCRLISCKQPATTRPSAPLPHEVGAQPRHVYAREGEVRVGEAEHLEPSRALVALHAGRGTHTRRAGGETSATEGSREREAPQEGERCVGW